MSGEIFFDNSALSRLVEESDVDRAALSAGLLTLGVLRVSALNVMETARTPDRVLRLKKLQFYRSLAGTVAPMNLPHELLAMIARAHHDGTGSIRAGDQHLYGLLADPETASDELRQALTEWATGEERRFHEIHETMRERLGELPEARADDRFATEAAFLDFAFENAEQTLGKLVTGFYRDATGAELAASDVPRFLEQAAPWKIFIAAHLHALWLRGVREKGRKKKAGIVDTESSAYLNFCDRFITNDHAQLETLRVANRFNPRTTVVELYTDLRSRLLL